MLWSEEKIQQVIRAVVKRANIDRTFREILLKAPDEAIALVTGKPTPEDLKIRFVENQGANLTVVLPDSVGNAELSADDLDMIAGGCIPTSVNNQITDSIT